MPEAWNAAGHGGRHVGSHVSERVGERASEHDRDAVSGAYPEPVTFAHEHVTWTVREVRDAVGASLIFESQDVIRRVRTYPGDWPELSSAELWALSWEA